MGDVCVDELKKRKTIRLQEYDYSTPGAYFLTLCTQDHHCILSRIVGTGGFDGPNIELLPYGKIAVKYLCQLNDFYEHLSVESYVIMPNHIHILLMIHDNGPSRTPADGPSGTPVPTAPQNSTVSRFLSTFKRFCNKECGKNIWQSRSYDHIIRDQADFDRHLKYIYENPFKWEEDSLYCQL